MSGSRVMTTTARNLQRLAQTAGLGLQSAVMGPAFGTVHQNNGFGQLLSNIPVEYMKWTAPAFGHVIGDFLTVAIYYHPLNYIRAKGGDSLLIGSCKIVGENAVALIGTVGFASFMILKDAMPTPADDRAAQYGNGLAKGFTGNMVFQGFRGATAEIFNKFWPPVKEEKLESSWLKKVAQSCFDAYGNTFVTEAVRQAFIAHGYNFAEKINFIPLASMAVSSVMRGLMHVVAAEPPFGAVRTPTVEELKTTDLERGMKTPLLDEAKTERRRSFCEQAMYSIGQYVPSFEDIKITAIAAGKTVKTALPVECTTHLLAGGMYGGFQLLSAAANITSFQAPGSSYEYAQCHFAAQVFIESSRSLLSNGAERLRRVFSFFSAETPEVVAEVVSPVRVVPSSS